MKLRTLELTNHVSHSSTCVDFGEDRLVVLAGHNGAGKSSLIESALYALYDAGRAKTDQLVRLGATEMAVVVTFDMAGSTYRVTRGRTTRAGGKSFLELAVLHPDGLWRPMTGDDIRTTQAAIEDLLRLDAATFTSAAFLRQGEADRFTSATAAERKRVLAAALDLGIWERAEAEAKQRVNEEAAAVASYRERLDRLDYAIDELRVARDVVEQHQGQIQMLELEEAGLTERIQGAAAELQQLAADLVRGEAAEADVARLGGERNALQERWIRLNTQRQGRAGAIVQYEATLRRAADVDGAAAALPGAQAAVAALEAAEARLSGIRDELRGKQDRLADERRSHEAAVAAFEGKRTQLLGTISTLTTAIEALQQAECPKCGERFAADPADLAGRREMARQELKAVGDPPVPPLSLARAVALVAGLEAKIRELAFDPDRLRGERSELMALERTAAAAGEMSAARASLQEATADVASLTAELEQLTTAGAKVKADHDAALVRVGSMHAVRVRQIEVNTAITTAREAKAAMVQRRAAAAASLARAEANVAQLDRLQAERDEVATLADAQDLHLGRLRRLVAAFGVRGIPARIIEGVLPELAGYANELLSDLRPGMSLAIRAQRDKKSGDGVIEALDLILQDDVGERPLAVFSGGERMSVSLALAVALSRLVARRAGTAIRTLVIDEPDGLDADARRAFGQALRVLAHRGELERVVLVSHHEDLADIGDATYRVTNGPGGSIVQRAA